MMALPSFTEVEYLNAHTVDGTEVVVLELDYSRVGDVEILSPRSFGEEAARRKRVGRARPGWTEADLFERLAADGPPEEVDAARRLFDWAASRVHHFYWGEGRSPSVTMAFETVDGMIQPCSIYTGTWAGIGVNFEYMRKRPRSALEAVLAALSDVPTIVRARTEIVAKDFAKRPTVPLAELTGERMATLITALDDLLAHPGEDGLAAGEPVRPLGM